VRCTGETISAGPICQEQPRISGTAAAKKAPYPADTDLPGAARTAVMAGSGAGDRAGLADDQKNVCTPFTRSIS